MSKSLKEKIVNGAKWNIVATAGYQVFGFVVFVVLSRLLTPAEFGTVALAFISVEFVNIFVQFGMVDVLIREHGITEKNQNTIFWLCLVFGAIGSVAIYVLAPFIGGLFQVEGLSDVLRVFCVVPIIHSLNTVPEALLKKTFGFKSLAYRLLISTSIAGMVSVGMAFSGFGLYSLVFQRVSSIALMALILWLTVSWRPRFEYSGCFARGRLMFARPIVMQEMLSLGSMRFVEIIIGAFIGPAAVGFYKIACKLLDFVVQIFIKPVVDVSMPAFSAVNQDLVAVEKLYIKFIQVCSLLALPVFLGLASLSPELVVLIFGDGWMESGMAVQILCLSSCGLVLNYFFKPLVTAIAKPRLSFRLKVIDVALVVCLLPIFAKYGLAACLITYVVTGALTTSVMLVMICKGLGFSAHSIMSSLLPSTVSSIVMVLVLVALKSTVLAYIGPTLGLLFLVGLGVCAYVISFFIFFRSKFHELKVEVLELSGL